MTSAFVPVNTPLLDGNEAEYLAECIRTGWISSEGPFIKRFEESMASAAGRRHGISVTNGSVALDLAVHALGLEPGDEVIIPTFTIISCAAAIVRAGLVPVAVDCDPATWNMTIEGVEAAVTSRTRAIMLVHIYGLPVDLAPIIELARNRGFKIIEDAAEMHGQTYRGAPCGSFGDVSTFSFYPNKHVTTGEGGMILTDDDALADRLASLRNLCFQPQQRFIHEELGWNARMTNLQAALGVAQVERLPRTVEIKRRIGRLYDSHLENVEGIRRPVPRTNYADNIYWVYGIVLNDDVPFDAKEAMRRLAEKGIGTRPFFWCMHEQPVLRRMGFMLNERHPIAERIARRGFYLPSGLALTEDEIARSAQALKEILA
ncbi:DegT/DnrJ/EryC1/StrS family aminotransferase [Bradyrhizobium guangdongense]|uniref:Aminotransferase DegT n=1 Tax=Bradyrhizobium guangdongense TaxID=1325090 RepID=A0A410V4P1_9BRAD|nr:DegT/DnrJ/EryC1/StrS family aminotransferase [Bradyrhizobium guangdongense]QAU38600.1 aminotransferase DegT [Bradyrhizobium guangdongense]QOZ59660.1 aminotransferase DegT [Bradyrhizobium guangdongense]GGI29156.1 aminotransferase DegT [Bradyrhizobium guangdongense]